MCHKHIAYNMCNKYAVLGYMHNLQNIAKHLEQDIKQTLAGIVDKSCDCGFQASMIDKGEFSCQTFTSSVTYR